MDPQTDASSSKNELAGETLTSTGSGTGDSGIRRDATADEDVFKVKTVQERCSVQTAGDSLSLDSTGDDKPSKKEDLLSQKAHQEEKVDDPDIEHTQETDTSVVTDNVENNEYLSSIVTELASGKGSPLHTNDVRDTHLLKIRCVDSLPSSVTKEHACNGIPATERSMHELQNAENMENINAIEHISDVTDTKTNGAYNECNAGINCNGAHNKSSVVEENPAMEAAIGGSDSMLSMKTLKAPGDLCDVGDDKTNVLGAVETTELKESKDSGNNFSETSSAVPNETDGETNAKEITDLEEVKEAQSKSDYEEFSNETDAETNVKEITELEEVKEAQSKSDSIIGKEGLTRESTRITEIPESIKQAGEDEDGVSNDQGFSASEDLEVTNSTPEEEASFTQTVIEESSSVAQLHHEHSVGGSSSVDSTAGSGWKLQGPFMQSMNEDANASDGEDSASGPSPVQLVPQQRKKIDIHHQFVREIVKIQHDREQADKQIQLGSKYSENKEQKIRFDGKRHVRNDTVRNSIQRINSSTEQHMNLDSKNGAGNRRLPLKIGSTQDRNELGKPFVPHGEDSNKGNVRSRTSKQPSISIYRPPVARDSSIEEQNVISSPDSSIGSVSESQFPTVGLYDSVKHEASLKVVKNPNGERHVHYIQSQSESTSPGMGIKVTFDTQKKQRHIEFKDMSNLAGEGKFADRSGQTAGTQSVLGSRSVDVGSFSDSSCQDHTQTLNSTAVTGKQTECASSQCPYTMGAFQFGTVEVNSKTQGRINIPEQLVNQSGFEKAGPSSASPRFKIVKQGHLRDKPRHNEGGVPGKPKAVGKKNREHRMKTREPTGNKNFLNSLDPSASADSNKKVDRQSGNMEKEENTIRQEGLNMLQGDLISNFATQSAPQSGVSTIEWNALYSTPMTEKWGDVVDDYPDTYDNVQSTADGETPVHNEAFAEEVRDSQNTYVNRISRSCTGKYSGIHRKGKMETEGVHDSPSHESPARKSVWERLGPTNDQKGSILGPPPNVLEKSSSSFSVHLDVNHQSPSMSQTTGPYTPNNDDPEVAVHAYTDVRQKKSKRELYGQSRAFY